MRIHAIASAVVLASTASAAPVWIESVNGDLSTDHLNPTSIAFALGSNTISGSVQATGDTRDFITFNIADGLVLSAIHLLVYTDQATGGNGDRGFIHLDDGTSTLIPDFTTVDSFLGASHLDRGLFPTAATNVLDILATAPLGGSGFATPLGPGDYTMNIQQTGNELTLYEFEFIIDVPSPSTASVMALMGAVALRRRR
ncbi:MAG: hypothetical protein ACF8GE_05870 [Phycisphaerales bacterium JB043]